MPDETADQPTELIPAITPDANEPTPGDAAPVADQPQRSRKGLRIGLGTFGGIILAVLAAYLIDLGVTSGEVERGTTVAGVEIGGMTPEQATAALNEQVLPQYTAQAVVTVHGEEVSFDPADAGLHPDIAQAVTAAGTRSASPVARIGSFFRAEDVPLHVSVDEAALTEWVTKIAADMDVTAVEGAVTKEGSKVTVVVPVIGEHVDIPAAAQAISTAWQADGPAGIAALEVPTTQEPVRATEASVAAAQQQAEAILSAPVTIMAADKKPLNLTVDQIAAATTIAPDDADGFTVGVDVAKLRAPLAEAAKATELSPKDAVLALVDGAPKITPSVTGRTVNWEATDTALAAALKKASTDNKARVVELSYATTPPKFSTDAANKLGVKEVIGEFTTGGFVWASGQNIKTLAEKMNGVLIQPHATFSINDYTGPRGVDQGYIEAGIIQEGRADKAVGGGISQFATTLYNASYFAGMTDVTHTEHSYYISRYPEGREATIFDGVIDLAFKNDFDTAVMVQTIWTENDITVRLWGTKHVEVESVTSDRFDYTSPPSTTIPYGQSCNPSGGTNGFSVTNTRIIKDLQGKEIARQDRTTRYNGQYQVICEPPPPPPPTTPVATPGATPGTTPPAAEPPPATTPPAGS